MADRWVVVSLPTPSLNAAVTGPFRSEDKARQVADSLSRTADVAGNDVTAIAQVIKLETIAEVRQHVKDGTL